MIILIGASASGKSSIQKELIKLGYKAIIPYTTRPKRENEIDGKDYNFISLETFNWMKEKNMFAEVACYNNWWYATAKEDYSNCDAVVILTPKGFRQIKKNIQSTEILSFYINVDRRSRLINILNRGDDIEEAYRRNVSDVGQFDGVEDEVDYIICNEEYHKSPSELAYIIDKIYKFKIVDNTYNDFAKLNGGINLN